MFLKLILFICLLVLSTNTEATPVPENPRNGTYYFVWQQPTCLYVGGGEEIWTFRHCFPAAVPRRRLYGTNGYTNYGHENSINKTTKVWVNIQIYTIRVAKRKRFSWHPSSVSGINYGNTSDEYRQSSTKRDGNRVCFQLTPRPVCLKGLSSNLTLIFFQIMLSFI